MYLQIRTIVMIVAALLPAVSLGQEEVSGNSTDDNFLHTESIESEAINPARNPEDFVVNVNFHFIEEKLPEFIWNTLNTSIKAAEITVSDLISLTKLDKYTLDEAQHFLDKYNITTSEEPFSVDSLEEMSTFVGAHFLTFYDYLRSRTSIDMNTFDALEINGAALANALVFDREETYNILRNGTYSESNVDNALATISLTRDSFFQIVRDFFVQELSKMDAVVLWRTLGLTKEKFLTLWNTLELSPEDIYQSSKFKCILDDTLNKLNGNISIGIFTNTDKLLIHRKIYENFCNIFATGVIGSEVVTHSGETFEIVKYSQHLTLNLVELLLNDTTEKYVPIPSTSSEEVELKNCTYFTTDPNSFVLIAEELDIFEEDKIATRTVKKNDNTIFNLGSPLVCDYQFEGLAASDNETHIVFDRYYEDIFTDQNLYDSGSSKLQNNLINLVPIILYFSLFGS